MTGAVVDLAGLGAEIEWTDSAAAAEARSAAGSARGTGRLDELREWVAATTFRFPPRAPSRPVCIVAGPVSDQAAGVASQVGASIDAVEVDDLDTADDTAAAFAVGVAAADAQVDAGCDLLIVADPDRSPAPALLVSVLTDVEPVALLPRGAHAIDTAAWIYRAETLRDLRPEVVDLRIRPMDLLHGLERPSLAATAGLIMRAAARRTPMILDGAGAAAAALLCNDVQARAGRWWRFADRSPDPVHAKVVDELRAQPLLDLATSSGDGVAGLLTLPLLRAATVRAGRPGPRPRP